jgi:hypothetical protein
VQAPQADEPEKGEISPCGRQKGAALPIDVHTVEFAEWGLNLSEYSTWGNPSKNQNLTVACASRAVLNHTQV